MPSTQTIYLAHTVPVNPPSAHPTLTHAQVFAGLNRKVRHAEEFLPGAIASTIVLSETKDEDGNDVVEREIVFAEGGKRAKERVVAHGDLEHVFIQEDGSVVHNIISNGGEGGLFLTFTFAFKVQGDEKVAKERLDASRAIAPKAVGGTIDAIRRGTENGTIVA